MNRSFKHEILFLWKVHQNNWTFLSKFIYLDCAISSPCYQSSPWFIKHHTCYFLITMSIREYNRLVTTLKLPYCYIGRITSSHNLKLHNTCYFLVTTCMSNSEYNRLVTTLKLLYLYIGRITFCHNQKITVVNYPPFDHKPCWNTNLK